MFNKIYKIGFGIFALSLPFVVGAQAPLSKTTSFFENAKDLVSDTLIPIAFLLALLFFFWGVAKYIWSEGTAKSEGRQIMIWGIVALFVMSSVWGLVSLLRDELDLDTSTQGTIPTIK